jgi:hypothetical protein
MFEAFFLFDSFWGLYLIACHFCKFFAFLSTPKAPHPTFRHICSGVTNGYRGDGQALEMGRKVGWGAFGVDRKAKNLQK